MQMKSSSRAFAGAVLVINTAFVARSSFDLAALCLHPYVLAQAPTRHFSAFVANKNGCANRPLGLPCVTLGWPLGHAWVTLGWPNPNPIKPRNANRNPDKPALAWWGENRCASNCHPERAAVPAANAGPNSAKPSDYRQRVAIF